MMTKFICMCQSEVHVQLSTYSRALTWHARGSKDRYKDLHFFFTIDCKVMVEGLLASSFVWTPGLNYAHLSVAPVNCRVGVIVMLSTQYTGQYIAGSADPIA